MVLVRKSYARLSLVAALNLGSTSESAVMLTRNCPTLHASIASRKITDFAREFMITTPLFMELEGFRHRWGWFLVLGILMLILGTIALIIAPAATLGTVLVWAGSSC